ncbi:MBOAT family protein [Ramlibacter sp. WS9]|uniref:MBOAT family O-acyltransferase n=1 Tax=Ramlibacter sp. WS9 TaxID=1882741 RepID=UPI0011419998|nr:MBOAT family O-acyltransferase [Ramlibacter sp. WS9]ROZ79138.1 MBOAT family protein [Ramlibacter sp. WS9]
MPFNTLSFLLFLIVVFSAHRIARSWRAKKLILLAASLLFYAAWNPPFILLLLAITVVTWWLVRLVQLQESEAIRKRYLVASVFVLLIPLAYFKYAAFVLEQFVAALAVAGVQFKPAPFDVMLPIGISFYTFHALSYTIDVYRRQTLAPASLLDFALYMSFFPQLVAGPIVRASHFLPQLDTPRTVTGQQVGWGLALFVLGLFQKTVLADTIFAPVVDQLYNSPQSASAWDAWAGVLAFSGQIFCDFAGYSTCAIGLALCFGFIFPLNFRSPYGAIGFSDFWRRWHISLSSWLRDYLYIPLGGGRGTTLRVGRNLMVTMLLGGLWHGASLMFLFWGGLHGTYLLLERLGRRHLRLIGRYFSSAGMAVATFLVATLTWIPFRASDAGNALAVLSALARPGFPDLPPGTLFASSGCSLALVILHIWGRDRTSGGWFLAIPRPAQTMLLGICLIGIFLVSGGEPRAFIYFQF